MTLLEQMKEKRAALKAELDAINTAVETRADKNYTTEEDARFDSVLEEIRKSDERIDELIAAEKREQAASAHVAQVATVHVTNEPNPVYRKDSTESYFRDMAFVKTGQIGEVEARARLVGSQETRAGDMSTVAAAGGTFAPPKWIVEEFVALARPGRVTADLVQHETLPAGVSSINLPKVASGSTVAVQATQNSALSDTAMTTTSVSSGITTLGGKQIVSLQLLQQSGIPFDRVILQDLAMDYAVKLDQQVLYGTNANGQLNGLVGLANNTAFTSATPSPSSVTNANSFYYSVMKAAVAVQTGIYRPATAIVMHPVRWAWILSGVDTAGRPLATVNTPMFNGLVGAGDPTAQGAVGTLAGYPVYTDPNISLTANSATNQDEVYVIRKEELWLYESDLQTASFDATYADQASILFRVLGYAAFIPNRYTAAIQSVRGTGLIAP
jgi:HK97 family phage major capsid protein